MASRSQTEQQQTAGTQDIGEILKELELKIERLKVLYEQYFMGIEKMEPQVARKEVTRTMLTLQQQYIRNTAMRFKFNTMLQKWQIYITYWNRVLREIENGTYVRHLAKAKRKAEREGRELPPEMHFDKVRPPSGTFKLDEETGELKPRFHDHETGKHAAHQVHDELEEVWDRLVSPTEAKRASSPAPAPGSASTNPGGDPKPAGASASRPSPPAPPPLPPRVAPPPLPTGARAPTLPPPPARPAAPAGAPPAAAAPPRPPSAAMLPKIPGMNEQELRTLHQRYVDAQKASGSAGAVKYETLVNSLAKQVPGVLSKPGVKGVRFDVTVENGKPILKAIPKK